MNLTRKISRRKFIAASLMAAPALAAADGRFVEPTWLSIKRLRLSEGTASHRFVHFSDVHHKGDRKYLATVIEKINALSPEFVCFTGDIMENRDFLPEALELFGALKAPLFGVPGNHDYWAYVSFAAIEKQFAATGGAWLMDQHREVGKDINLVGLTCISSGNVKLPLDPHRKNIVLMHYPAWVKKLKGQKCDLLLAGHSHGGQVRIPFYGPLVVPFLVDQYNMGLYQTDVGPLYVNPGIGYIGDFDIRFNCRPEITLIEI